VNAPTGPDWGTPPAVVLGVHDGDTITVDCDRGLETRRSPTDLRLNGVDAPELRVRDPVTGKLVDNPPGLAARDYLRVLLPVGSRVLIRTFKTRAGTRERRTFGRYVADFYAPTERGYISVADALVVAGHAHAARRLNSLAVARVEEER
jgi:endonuclease YncB( thermonuclease family)